MKKISKENMADLRAKEHDLLLESGVKCRKCGAFFPEEKISQALKCARQLDFPRFKVGEIVRHIRDKSHKQRIIGIEIEERTHNFYYRIEKAEESATLFCGMVKETELESIK
jgi:hypothetical protein